MEENERKRQRKWDIDDDEKRKKKTVIIELYYGELDEQKIERTYLN